MSKSYRAIFALLLVALLQGGAAAPAASEPPTVRSPAPAALPTLVVHKSPTCGCCHNWVQHMRKAGFPVEVRDTNDLGAIKAEVKLPYGLGSCHTAQVGDYFVEGHVPAEDVKRLLAKRPAARGLAVPGMPIGSPGMEQGARVEPYDVLVVAPDGTTTVFARHSQ